MLEFPRLKTGAGAQYPVVVEMRAATRVFTFLDGRQQRFPASRPCRKWRIEYDELDETEAARLEEFSARHRETAEPFRFTDPLTGREHWPCYLEGREQVQVVKGPGRRKMTLIVVEGIE